MLRDCLLRSNILGVITKIILYGLRRFFNRFQEFFLIGHINTNLLHKHNKYYPYQKACIVVFTISICWVLKSTKFLYKMQKTYGTLIWLFFCVKPDVSFKMLYFEITLGLYLHNYFCSSVRNMTNQYIVTVLRDNKLFFGFSIYFMIIP